MSYDLPSVSRDVHVGQILEASGLGRVFMAVTNFSDGVLIETEDGRYIITPRNPDEFIKAVAPSI